ncbi:MAG: carbohydrate porin [Gammaproteobacteria bacterium]|nr:carbohydrate porin [Gammaproteobacteria bacterium]MBU1603258.1 carbohydrate porin [Gammaproteobacteria bacterium]MBU2432778.1 carbohydrate porin [Gammaproteobacteria bacterium]MBU2450021.1 carbohydrate porin [Gammaproteobacteria bacterium]
MKLAKITAALVVAGLALPALAASDAATLQKLMERMEKLEARNAELEKQVKSLKSESEEIAKGLDSPRLSENEPELTVRLKAVEKDALEMKKSASLADKFDGIKVGAALTTVAQHATGLPTGTADGGGQLNYRADVSVELPLDPIGDIEQKVFAHVRIGQGQGLNGAFGNLGLFASAPNSVAFRASGANADDSVAILGQAWYQAAIPLPFGGFTPYSREKLELTFGKMDIFGFFDQNEAAGDESVQFLNSVFVHNPLLDAGGEVGVDANGFQPGFVASYLNYRDGAEPWRLSLGVFGAGDRGANYQKSLSTPLLMVQAEKQVKISGGLSGNYRAYAWTRSQATELDGVSTAKHTGFGVSVDQQVGDGIKLFGRYGQLVEGELPFDQALSVGAEISGNYWGRGADAIGVGASWLKASSAYRAAGGEGDIDGDGTADFTFTPSGAEKVAEIYYRFRVSPQFEITPDFQWIGNPGTNRNADSVKVFAVRANIAY